MPKFGQWRVSGHLLLLHDKKVGIMPTTNLSSWQLVCKVSQLCAWWLLAVFSFSFWRKNRHQVCSFSGTWGLNSNQAEVISFLICNLDTKLFRSIWKSFVLWLVDDACKMVRMEGQKKARPQQRRLMFSEGQCIFFWSRKICQEFWPPDSFVAGWLKRVGPRLAFPWASYW